LRCVLLLLPLIACTTGHAQTAGTGALTGNILDPSGAAVVGAQVKAMSETTEETRTVLSSENGSYFIPLLLPGLYAVEIVQSGFKTAHIEHVRVSVAETGALSVRLELGARSDQIIVQAETEGLQRESSTLGRVTEGEQVRALPLATRNYSQIIALNPGVSAEVTDASLIGPGFSGPAGPGLVANGGTIVDNNFQMNGVGINDLQSGAQFTGGIAIPNPDTIEEFKVQTSQYDASFGRNAGANVDVVTRSGTTDFHGGAWEFFRNDALDANTFFRNRTGQARPVLKQNQFGFDLGGPIRKEKLLFFISYQGTRQRNGVDANCSSQINSPPISNDRSPAALGQLFAGQRGVIQTTLGVGPAVARDGSNINPVALALLQMKLANGAYVIPTPQTLDASRPFESQGFSTYSVGCPYLEDQFMTNGDWEISPKSKIFGRFFFANAEATLSVPGTGVAGATTPGFPAAFTNNYRNFTLTYNYVFSHLLNQAIAGYHRTFAVFDQSKVFSFSSIGATVPSFDDDLPVIALDLGSQTGLSLGGNGQGTRIVQNTFTFEDTVSFQRGSHSIRFGGGVSHAQVNHNYHNFAGEAFLSWADFLLGLDAEQNGTASFAPLGLASSNIFFSTDFPGLFGRVYGTWDANTYFQDNVKLGRRLTLNLGFRYDRLGHISDALGRNSSLDYSLLDPNPPATGTLAGYVVPLNYSGGAIPAGVTQSDNEFAVKGEGQNTWNPRVGFAWQPPHMDRSVLRGGYGIYHSRYTGGVVAQLLNNPPFAQNRFFILGTNAAATESVPLPRVPVNLPSFPTYSPDTALSTKTLDPNFRPPMMQEYSLGLQTQLPSNFVLDVGYSGARGLHLIRQRSINQAGIASLAKPIREETKNTLANVRLRVPFQGWDPANLVQFESAGASWYNALMAGLNKRFSRTVQAQISYTFSRNFTTDPLTSVGQTGGFSVGDQNNPKQRYGPDYFVREDRLIANWIYQFPSPKNLASLRGRFLGGWKVAGVATLQSGHKLLVLFNP